MLPPAFLYLPFCHCYAHSLLNEASDSVVPPLTSVHDHPRRLPQTLAWMAAGEAQGRTNVLVAVQGRLEAVLAIAGGRWAIDELGDVWEGCIDSRREQRMAGTCEAVRCVWR